jgi:hypothetical protein
VHRCPRTDETTAPEAAASPYNKGASLQQRQLLRLRHPVERKANRTGWLVPAQCVRPLWQTMAGVEDCVHDNYDGAPQDGSAWTAGDCETRTDRGGSWGDGPQGLRTVARTLTPYIFTSLLRGPGGQAHWPQLNRAHCITVSSRHTAADDAFAQASAAARDDSRSDRVQSTRHGGLHHSHSRRHRGVRIEYHHFAANDVGCEATRPNTS